MINLDVTRCKRESRSIQLPFFTNGAWGLLLASSVLGGILGCWFFILVIQRLAGK